MVTALKRSALVTRDVTSVGLAVRAERSRRGMTRRALAWHAGISERYLADLERGKANASLAVLFGVARALSTPAWTLMPASPAAPSTFPDSEDSRPGPNGIALVGLRGGGKSTLGQGLASALGLRFVRLGDVIESLGAMAQGELISLAGQRAYRRLERDALQQIISDAVPVVLETGGSLVAESTTYEILLKQFYTVWIRAEPGDHMQRVIDQGDLRPMAGHRAAMDDLNAILAERTRDYERAHANVMTSGSTVTQSLRALKQEVETYTSQLAAATDS